MTQPRSTLISLSDTPYYHCVSRCVRQAFLCGEDRKSGKSYEHRREWLEQKLLCTADSFAIRVCAYSIMSNHYHVVLRVCPEQADEWSFKEVVFRWHSLYSGTVFSRRFMAGEALSTAERHELNQSVTIWRERLTNISLLMKIVNHALALMANEEDQCKGHFWESRFKSQALLDDRALLACMAYVDLNPIRAKLARTPEDSDHTSIKNRIDSIAKKTTPVKCLDDFVGIKKDVDGIPFKLEDYIDLVEWSGRIIHPNKRGFIKSDEPEMLSRLSLDKDAWHTLVTQFEQQFGHWVGSEHIVRQVYEDHHYQRTPSTRSHRCLFG